MNLILFISIVIRFIAMAWSIVLLRRLRDWRISFLSIMLCLMALRQAITLYNNFDGWYFTVLGHKDEIPGFIVSVLALLII